MKELGKPPISEESFSSTVEDLLKTFGWRYVHSRPARTLSGWVTALSGDKGFVDFTAVRDGVCLFIELKSDKGRLSEGQREWMTELIKVAAISSGVQYRVFRPNDFDQILEVLR